MSTLAIYTVDMIEVSVNVSASLRVVLVVAHVDRAINFGGNRAACQFYSKLENSFSFRRCLPATSNHVRAECDANRRNGRTSINANNASVNVAEMIPEELPSRIHEQFVPRSFAIRDLKQPTSFVHAAE